MEGGKAGDAVGGIRRVESDGQIIRHRLLAYSEVEHFYSCDFCDPVPVPVRGCMATLAHHADRRRRPGSSSGRRRSTALRRTIPLRVAWRPRSVRQLVRLTASKVRL